MVHHDSSIAILSPRWSAVRPCAFVYRNRIRVRDCAFRRISPTHVR
jgi:hypothetical protein